MGSRLPRHPFRDDFAAAVWHVDRLARENALLRARLVARGFHWVQWMLVGVLTLCGGAIAYILSAVG
jgi:hypothetical protein